MALRIITGAVGIVTAGLIIQAGGVVFAAAVTLLALVAWYEFYRAFLHHGMKLSYFGGMTSVAALCGAAFAGDFTAFVGVATALTLLVMTQPVFFHKKVSVADSLFSVAGIAYTGFSFAHFILLRFMEGDAPGTAAGEMEYGCVWLWIALAGTWASDTFAYFLGSAFGRRKLAPEISPKKTVEGLAGGLLGTAATTAALGSAAGYGAAGMFTLGVAIALVATVGDLVESTIKRYTGIKDSGTLIPGHGGVLDRFDSAMFVIPFVYYFVKIFQIARYS